MTALSEYLLIFWHFCYVCLVEKEVERDEH